MTDQEASAAASEPPTTAASLRVAAVYPAVLAQLDGVLHRRVYDADTLLDLMGRTCREAVKVFTSVQWAGVTAEFDGRPFTTAHTDDRVLVVDERQYAVRDGPCLRAMRTDTRVAMSLEQAALEWPHLAVAARRVGVHSFLAGPLHVADRPVGALNLYSAHHDADAVDLDLLAVLIGYLDRGLTDYQATRASSTTASALRAALARTGLVEEAVGILVQRFGFSTEYALETLIDQAEAEQRTVSQHAARILAGGPPGGH
jgi:hypothetical protein